MEVQLANLTEINFLQIFNPDVSRQLQKKLCSVSDLIKPENNTPSLGFLKNKVSEKLILTIIKLHIVELSDFLNLTRPLKESQIDITAQMILDEFPLIKIADMMYIFKLAKRGDFGLIYEGLDGSKILGWFRQVWSERVEYAESMSAMEHENIKRVLSDTVGDARTCIDTRNDVRTLINRAQGFQIQQEYEK